MAQSRLLAPGQAFADLEYQREFEDPKLARLIRHGFIRKVYGIVAAQLLFSTAVGTLFTVSEDASGWMLESGSPLVLFSLVMALVIVIVIACIPAVAERYPTNYILLFFFTLFESICLAGACVFAARTSGGLIVLEALACTSIVVIGLTCFACQTKYDFVSWAGALTIVLLFLATFGFAFLLFPMSPLIDAFYSAAIALVFAAYIVIDTQRIVGRGKVKLSENQYITAALLLYVDVINLFLNILYFLQALVKSRG